MFKRVRQPILVVSLHCRVMLGKKELQGVKYPREGLDFFQGGGSKGNEITEQTGQLWIQGTEINFLYSTELQYKAEEPGRGKKFKKERK